MTKAEIVEQIYERVGFSKKEAAELVEKVFEIIKDTLSEGEKVKISGFGNFVVRHKNARKGRNPQHRRSRPQTIESGRRSRRGPHRIRPARAGLLGERWRREVIG